MGVLSERRLLVRTGIREEGREERESPLDDESVLGFFWGGGGEFVRVQMARMWFSGRDQSLSAWSTSGGERLETGFPLAALAGVRDMLTTVGRSFGLFLTVRGMLLRCGPSFRPGQFYLLGRILQMGRQGPGSRIDGFGGWVMVVIFGG